MQEQELQEFNLVNITKAGLKYKKHIFIITGIGLLAGLVLAFIIKPKFEATTIFYPPANTSISKSILADNNLESLMEFGDEQQTDQMLQILNSEELKENVIQKFNLADHYDIDQDERYAKSKVKKEFSSNADFSRTDYLAVKITITDHDPVLAAGIANYISGILDSIRTNIQQARAKQAYHIIKFQYEKKQQQVDSILKNLASIRTQGIYDYESQSEVLSLAIVNAESQFQAEEARMRIYEANRAALPDTTVIKAKGRLEAARATLKALRPTIANFGKLSGRYLEYEALYEKEREALANLKLKYENAEVDFKKSISQKFMIDKAEIPEMKASPNRLLIVLMTGIVAFFISLMIAVYNEIVSARITLK